MTGDLPQILTRPPQGAALAHEVAQVGGAPGVQLRQAGGVRGREVDDVIEQRDVVQARGSSEVDELIAPRRQGIVHQGATLRGHGGSRNLGDGRSGLLLGYGR